MKPLKELDAPEIAAELLDQHPPLESAVRLATELHEGQVRVGPRGGKKDCPYIEHPLRVAARLSRAGADDQVLLEAALLHDTAEDCEEKLSALAGGPPSRDTSLGYLAQEFSSATAEVVELLSNPVAGNYFEHVTASVAQDPRALVVKTSDWLDNAGSLHHTPGVSGRRVRKYRPLTEVFLEQWDLQYREIQLLLNGNRSLLRERVVAAGLRLELLTQP